MDIFIKLIIIYTDNKGYSANIHESTHKFNVIGLHLYLDEGQNMVEKFLESIGIYGIDVKKYPAEHLPRILHLSMAIKNTCFWINNSVVSYRTLSIEEQTKILEEYVQYIINLQLKEI